MEDLCVENIIPHHATSVVTAEPTKVVEVAVEEEMLEKAGGDKMALKIEDLCAKNTIPHHATFVAIAEMVEVAPVVAKEETVENVGGDDIVEDIPAKSFSEGGGESDDVVCNKRGQPRTVDGGPTTICGDAAGILYLCTEAEKRPPSGIHAKLGCLFRWNCWGDGGKKLHFPHYYN